MKDRMRFASFILAVGPMVQFTMAAIAVHKMEYGIAVFGAGMAFTLLTVAIIHAIYGAQGR